MHDDSSTDASGGRQAHLILASYSVEPLSNATIHFSITMLVLVDVIQSGYERKPELKRIGQQA